MMLLEDFPSLMPYFVVTMDHFSTGHQERKNSYHSPAVDLLCKLFSCETYNPVLIATVVSMVSTQPDTLDCKVCTAQSEINFHFV